MVKQAQLMLLATILATGTAAAEWPQYRGPNRDGTSPETDLVWPNGGPKELWRRPIGPAFSAIAAVGGRLYTMDSDTESDFAISLDAATGREIWRTRIGAVFHDLLYGTGSLATPTVDGELVFVQSALGVLVALDRTRGTRVWEVDYGATFGSKQPQYGHSTSPLTAGDLLIVAPGGPEGKGIAGLDKNTGTVRWTVHDDDMAYSSPVLVEFEGSRLLVFITRSSALVVSLDGEAIWEKPFGEWITDKVAMPVFVEPDLLFFSASQDAGAFVVRMVKTAGNLAFEQVWSSRVMRNHWSSSVPVGRYIYGFDNATLKCIDATTGELRWAKRGFGKGTLIYADSHLWVLAEAGELLWVTATPDAFRLEGRLQLFADRRNWTEPTLSDGKLFVRNLEEIVSLDLSGGRSDTGVR